MKALLLTALLVLTIGCRKPQLSVAPPPVQMSPASGVLAAAGFSRIKETRELEIGHAPIPRLPARGERLFYVSLNGHFYQVNLNTLETEGDVKLTDGLYGTPALNYPLMFFSTERGHDGLQVYDLIRAKTVKELEVSPARVSPVIAASHLIHCALDGRISAFALPGLQKKWSVDLGQRIMADPLVSGGNILITGRDGHLASYRAGDGMLNWSIDLDDAFYTTPALWQNHLYWAAYSGKVYKISEESGAREGTYNGHAPIYQSPRINATGLYVPYADGTLKAFETGTKKVRWTQHLDGPFSAPLLLTNNVLYSSQMSRKFYILSLQDGAILQMEEPGGRPLSQPLQTDDRLYLMVSPGIIKEYQHEKK